MSKIKDRIGVLFGGRSQEHEISVLSAASLMDAIDRERHEIIPVAIGKDGGWYLIDRDMSGLRALDDPRMKNLIPDNRKDMRVTEKVRSEENGMAVPGADSMGDDAGIGSGTGYGAKPIDIAEFAGLVDFVFPMLHGPFGEDGTVQGLFETLGIPYAGCGVCGSAVAMDKIMTKSLLENAGLPVLPYVYTTATSYRADACGELERIELALHYPLFVKPANMGSSVGVRRADSREELAAAVDFALGFDRRVLVEEENNGRELEAAVLGNEVPSVGAVGEIVTGGGFYDYETKYERSAFELAIPADIPDEIEDCIKSLAISTYKVLDCAGFARVDFFAGKDTSEIYVNEVNTIPGFTQYSMFPRLWEAKGLLYPALIERIIALGYERHVGGDME